MDAALQALCNQTVTIAPYTGQNSSGEPQWGSAVSYQAQISGQNKLVWDSGGKQMTSTLRVILSTYATVNQKDKITLPSPYAVASPPILSVDPMQNESGGDHTTLHLR